MSTQTRTPEEIYEEMRALPRTPLGDTPTLAERIAWAESGVEYYAAERRLWRELAAALPADPAGYQPWQYAAVLCADSNAFEQEWAMRERLARYHEKERAALRDLPTKEEQ